MVGGKFVSLIHIDQEKYEMGASNSPSVMFSNRTHEPITCFQAVELQKLIIAHNNIESLKEELRNLPLLTVLNVSHNKLSELPAAIGECVLCRCVFVICVRSDLCLMFFFN